MSTASAELGTFIDASPTSLHAAAQVAARLDDAGFTALDPIVEWSAAQAAAPAYVLREGALVAWGVADDAGTPLRLIGAHTDSPGLRLRPRADRSVAGWRQLGVEVYGGALVNSWLDRDLRLAGRLAIRESSTAGVRTTAHLVDTQVAVARVPQLAIHLDREVNTRGLLLDPQRDLSPVWGLGDTPGDVIAHLAGRAGVDVGDVVAWDVALVDAQPSACLGERGELLAAARLDDLCCVWAGTRALIDSAANPVSTGAVAVLALHDHEEVGSTTSTGAAGTWTAQVLERRELALGGTRVDFLRSLSSSLLASADMAHATHPNRRERHEPDHHIRAGGGVVIKTNVNARYATASPGAAAFALACDAASVPVQQYSHRGDLPCGSTIGPIAAAGLAVETVDIGAPMLSMHSARELMACSDVDLLVGALRGWYTTP